MFYFLLGLFSFLFSLISELLLYFFFLFFIDPATTEIYTLSLHDALPISPRCRPPSAARSWPGHIPHRGTRTTRRGAGPDLRPAAHIAIRSRHRPVGYGPRGGSCRSPPAKWRSR